MQKINPAIQRYAWGEQNFIPDLLGFEQDGGPYAEAWYGAHPSAPSTFKDNEGTPLEDNRLRFLMKILAIRDPLSIQVHPNKIQAMRGFSAQREYLRVRSLLNSPDAPRTYADDNHKPETIVALQGGLEARAGIKSEENIEKTIALFGSIALRNLWRSDEVGTHVPRLIEQLDALTVPTRMALVEDVLSNGANERVSAEMPEELKWLNRCGQLYPGDYGIIIQAFMNYIKLQPGQGLHMGAGELHAYLRGRGIEIMACSDNVLRAGLTQKGVNVPELLKVASFTPSRPRIDTPSNGIFSQGVDDYILRRLAPLQGEVESALITYSPSIVLAIGGGSKLTDPSGAILDLKRGEAVYCQGPVVVEADGETYVGTNGI